MSVSSDTTCMNEFLPSSPTCSCPTCHANTRQHKAGKNKTGSLRRECQHCHRTYTPAPKTHGYALSLRQKALRMYVDGINFRRIGRLLSVSHQTVINWVNAAAARLPAPPTLRQRRHERADTLELDELYTFIGQKKSLPTC